MTKPKPYPTWVCYPCGIKHGRVRPGEGWMATFHHGTCDVCGELARVTEPRDFGHLNEEWKMNDTHGKETIQ